MSNLQSAGYKALLIERLQAVGYAYDDAQDGPLALQAIDRAVAHILNTCNLLVVPDGLATYLVDYAAGTFLSDLLAFRGGELGVELEGVVKKIDEGDTAVTFAVGEGSSTPEQRLRALIKSLLGDEEQLYRFRRLAW